MAHRALLIFALPLIGLSASAAQAQRPNWIKRPDGADIERLYPAEARAKGLGGLVRMGCKVTGEGRLEACAVITEEPKDAGFGDAALALASLFQMSAVAPDGKSVAGASIVIPIRFGTGAPPDPRNPETHVLSGPPLPIPPVRR